VVLPSLNTKTQTAHVKQLKPKTEAHIREEKFLLNFLERSLTVAKSKEADPVKTLTVTASSAETSVSTHLRTQLETFSAKLELSPVLESLLVKMADQEVSVTLSLPHQTKQKRPSI
jgi:uncharacterized protein involved in type VI secretion and phage assembly